MCVVTDPRLDPLFQQPTLALFLTQVFLFKSNYYYLHDTPLLFEVMPWVKSKAAMQCFDVKKDETGRPYFETPNPPTEQQRVLQAQTGTEADHQWPSQNPKTKPPPLLDLDLAWSQLIAEDPISASDDELGVSGDTVGSRNAALMVRELKYYLMASNAEREDEENEDDCTDEGHAEWRAPIPQPAVHIEEEGDTILKSVYGASILLKLQWEDRSVQKRVPCMTYHQLGLFVADIVTRLNSALEQNPSAAHVLLDAVALDLTPVLMARHLDGLETETQELEESCFALLKLCAVRANPKEMHMAIKTFLSKVDAVYMEATSYVCLQPLVELWGCVIPRMRRKRGPFLADFAKHWDRMFTCAESYQTSFVPDDGLGVERPGRIARLPDTLLEFYEKLIAAQLNQREDDDTIHVEVDLLGRPNPNFKALEPGIGGTNTTESTGTGGSEVKEKRSGFEIKAEAAIARENTLEWVRERAMTLAKVLQLLGLLWTRLPPPEGEDRDIPRRKMKERKKIRKRSVVVESEKEKSLAKCMGLFVGLGWSNPVLVCQLAANGLSLDHADRGSELMSSHIGHDARSKKERKNTLYSVTSVGLYLCGVLRDWTSARNDGQTETDLNENEIMLSGSVFDVLNPKYAFDLVLPYLMPIVGHSTLAVSWCGIMVLRAFLRQLSDGCFDSFDEVLRLRTGTSSGGKEINILGLLRQVSRTLEGYDDPMHRRIAYETLQAILRKCDTPILRYVMTECIYYQTRRAAVSGQLMTELKDTIIYSDNVSLDERFPDWNVEVANELRWRFAHDCFAKYFTPRRELLSFINQIATAASLMTFLVSRDIHLSEQVDKSGGQLLDEIERRKRFCKTYGKLGMECVRALASVAEHDRKNIPTSALAQRNTEDAMAVYQASGRTLNQCVGAISFLGTALEKL